MDENMTLDLQEIIRSIDKGCLTLSQERVSDVKDMLRSFKSGSLADEEKELLIRAMEQLKSMADTEKKQRVYNVLVMFYFADEPLTFTQIADVLVIGTRTVFKDINYGVKELCVLLYGIDAFTCTDNLTVPNKDHNNAEP